MLKSVTNFFGNAFKKGSTLRFIKRKDLFCRDQHHKEVYSVNFGELFFCKTTLNNAWESRFKGLRAAPKTI